MIRLPSSPGDLSPEERFGLAVLVDLSRVLPCEDLDSDVVRLEMVADGRADAESLRDWLARGWGRGIEVSDGVVRVSRAALRMVTRIAGAVAEQQSEAEDRYGRVPSAVNELVAGSRERTPVMSHFASAFRRAVADAAGPRPVRFLAPWPHGKRWAAAITHDLDLVAFWPLLAALRAVELAKHGELGQLQRVVAAGARALAGDPVSAAVRAVLEAEQGAGWRSTWFIICGTPSLRSVLAGDVTYRPESRRARDIVAAVARAGHEIALHGSFTTMLSGTDLRAQRGRLATISGAMPAGVRQHFLRMRPVKTQHGMVEAGFTYDSTFGFPDRGGFRLGVADVIPAWDDRARAPLALEYAPLAWMDRTLSKYASVHDPGRWIDDGLDLAQRCREVDGLWVGLWHPNLAPALGYPGAPEAFAHLLRELAARDPYVATLSEIVAWRVARRGVRAARVNADGTVGLRSEGRVPAPVTVVDVHGAAREVLESS